MSSTITFQDSWPIPSERSGFTMTELLYIEPCSRLFKKRFNRSLVRSLNKQRNNDHFNDPLSMIVRLYVSIDLSRNRCPIGFKGLLLRSLASRFDRLCFEVVDRLFWHILFYDYGAIVIAEFVQRWLKYLVYSRSHNNKSCNDSVWHL